MFDEDLNDSSTDACNGARKPKKPIPLPRKHIPKLENNDESDGSSGSGRSTSKKLENFFSSRNDKKSASEIVQEKKMMMKNEVQKLEKSVRNMISKRRSVHPKSSAKMTNSQFFRSNSLPDDNIFCSISFNSPLSDDIKCNEEDLKGASESDLSSNDGSNYTSDLPPPYPPPDLPDESLYDEATSVASSDGQCSYLPSSDSNSLYEDLTKYQTLSKITSKTSVGTNDNIIDGPAKSDSWSFYDSVESNESRYEVISEWTDNELFSLSYHPPGEILKPNPYKISENMNSSKCDEVSVIKPKSFSSSVVRQFDPLSEKESGSNLDLMCDISESFKSLLNTIENDDGSAARNTKNPFQNPVILSSLCEEEGNVCEVSSSAKEQLSCLIEGHYGKVRKREKYPSDHGKSEAEELDKYDVELPPSFSPPPVPPRRFDSIEPKDEVDKRRTSIIRWSSMKRVAKMVAENIENRASWSTSSFISDKRKTDKKTELDGKADGCAYLPVMLNHSGVLFKSGGIQRWGVLSQRKLTLFVNKDSPDIKETIPIDNISSIKAVNDSKIW